MSKDFKFPLPPGLVRPSVPIEVAQPSGNRRISWDFIEAPVRTVAPLDIGGGYTTLHKAVFPDNASGVVGDRRLHLDVKMLAHLLDIARSSPTGRVVLHGVQVEVTQFRTPNGHVFESWSFVGVPVAEGGIKDTSILANVGQVRNRAERS